MCLLSRPFVAFMGAFSSCFMSQTTHTVRVLQFTTLLRMCLLSRPFVALLALSLRVLCHRRHTQSGFCSLLLYYACAFCLVLLSPFWRFLFVFYVTDGTHSPVFAVL